MALYLPFKRNNKAFSEINLKSILCLMQILYIFQYITLNKLFVFLGVTICNIPGDCCNFFTFMCMVLAIYVIPDPCKLRHI